MRFTFRVAVAQRDRPVLVCLQTMLGRGSIYERVPRSAHWQPNSVFSIGSHSAHRATTIPFMEQYLLPCAKRLQFDRWRAALNEYERLHPNRFGKGPSRCAIADCDRPVRGRGLCRSHYYRVTGY